MALDTVVHRENTDVGWVGFHPPLFIYFYKCTFLGKSANSLKPKGYIFLFNFFILA
jgi:hypothetical protein